MRAETSWVVPAMTQATRDGGLTQYGRERHLGDRTPRTQQPGGVQDQSKGAEPMRASPHRADMISNSEKNKVWPRMAVELQSPGFHRIPTQDFWSLNQSFLHKTSLV